nr:chromate resistance protein [Candidatus Sigynarchaeota archaeon]
MKWITRERAKVDRIACPWLIKKFVDHTAEFFFAPAGEVMAKSKELGATPFDVEGAELMHFKMKNEERVSFDAIIEKYKISDPAALELAKIVRGADAKITNPPAESAGLIAAAAGFREIANDDFDNLRLQFPLYDALYAFCQLKVKKRQMQ